MTHRQHPIGTGFTAASTADEVLKGIDLSGTNVVITGGHAGLGLETTRALSRAGASVIAGARGPGRAAAALAGLERVEIDRLDLLDPASIDAFAARFVDSGRPLHVLINNAGGSTAGRVLDARGYESAFAANHLGHFQLTLGLLPGLRAAHGARVVNVSSGAHRICDIRWDDPHFATGFEGHLAYGQSKTANVLFAVELDRRWSGDGIRGYALHPGVVVATTLTHLASAQDDGRSVQGLFDMDQLRAQRLIDDAGRPIIDPDREKKTPEQGAATIVFAAAGPQLAGIGGVYLKNSDVAPLNDTPSVTTMVGGEPVVVTEVAPHPIDPASARRLWELSERLLKA
ncbi:SDR family NAD(P)-dependent oxidoreductase [Nonomuraea maheshkhaliensis]|uniref:SDR family NAD(P)-dependent oxidoreductase n=1 Tax=Nonomuraea maheshkhaliensis TaxID=419590 RepID=A0ABP4RNU0_9ACTN